ncbi:endolysin [Vibrio phage D85]|nr:hypothetical protein PODOV033v1_p0041 [Vibrio phage 252E42.2]
MFDLIFERVIGHEGGFTDNPKDPGNWTGGKVGKGELKGTKFGLAAHSYPHLDIKNITIEQAKAEYRKWYDSGLDRFIPSMQYQMFDAAFNHGMRWANKFYQRAVGVNDDGIIGPMTLAAGANMGENDKLLRFIGYRTRFFTDLKHFNEFGRGWIRRISQNLLYAAEDNQE